MTALFDDPRVAELLGGGLAGAISGIFAQMEICEDEIRRARGADPDEEWDEATRNDPLWQSFMLLRATDERMATEIVYRAHCRELLERVAAGADTRPGTDAEILCGISDASLRAPLPGAVVGLMMRLFARRLPDQADRVDVGEASLADYERMYGAEIDEWERKLRRQTTQDWRRPETAPKEER